MEEGVEKPFMSVTNKEYEWLFSLCMLIIILYIEELKVCIYMLDMSLLTRYISSSVSRF